jgi:outer membrane protein
MKHILIIASLLFAIGMNGYAQQDTSKNQTYNFSVADCVNYAYQHQHDVVNANLDVTSAAYHVKEIIGQGYPQINASASFTDYIKSPVIVVSPTQSFKIYLPYNSSIGLSFTQIIFDPSYLVGLAGRRTYKQLYDRSYTRTKIEANVNVTKAYYQVLVSVEQLKLLEANIKELKQQLDETTARNKQGFVEQIDVQRLTVQYNSLVTNRENTIRLLALNYELLKFQMGMPIADELTLKDKLEDVNLNAPGAEAASDTSAYHNRIEYGLLETQEKLNEYDLKLKKGQFLPKLTANGSYSPAYMSNSFGSLYNAQYPTAFVGLNLTIPIFTGWQHLNQYKESKINVLKSENDLVNMKNTIDLQVEQARISYINGLQTLNDQKKNMALAEEVLRVTKIKYEQGVGSSIEVTQAETDVTQADNTYIQGLYDALVSKVDLDKAYGRIQ